MTTKAPETTLPRAIHRVTVNISKIMEEGMASNNGTQQEEEIKITEDMSEEELMRALAESKKDHNIVKAEGNIDQVEMNQESAYDQEIKWDENIENAVPGSVEENIASESEPVLTENIEQASEMQPIQAENIDTQQEEVPAQSEQPQNENIMFNLQEVRDHHMQIEAAQRGPTQAPVPQFNDDMGLHIRG